MKHDQNNRAKDDAQIQKIQIYWYENDITL